MRDKVILTSFVIFFYPALLICQDFWEPVAIPEDMGISQMITGSNGYIYIGSRGNIAEGVYRSTDNGSTWEFFDPDPPPYELGVYSLGFNQKGNILAGVAHKIYKSNDYGESWYQVFQPIIINAGNVLCFESGFDSIVFAGAAVDNGIIRSADYGETWSVVHAFTYEELVYDITISPGGVVWAGTDNIYGTTGAYRSYDMGLTWEYTGPDVQVYSIELNTLGEVFAGTNVHGLYKYNGAGWDNIVPGHSVRWALTAPSGDMFLACKWYPYNNGGVMRSQDNGQTFVYENSGLDIWDVDGLAMGPDNYLYTWDYSPAESKGISKLFRSKDPVTSTDDLLKINNGYISITPNPFRSEARIYISGFDPGKKLHALIFNMAGSEVWEGEMISGESIQFESNGLKPGIYILSLKAKGTVAGVRKVIVY